MRAVVMIIRRVHGKKPLQMARVQSDDVVEQIAAAAPHPTLGHSILPRTPNRGLHARDLQGAKGSRVLPGHISGRDRKAGILGPIRKGRLLLAVGRSNWWWDAE